MKPRIVAMVTDPSWDVVPVADPDLPERQRERLFDRAVLKDPVGLAEPAYQYRDRELIVVPSALDQPSRVTDLRAEHAMNLAASVGPTTNAVLKSQEGALAHAHESLEAKVAELERYAACVSAVAAAYRDWQDALRVADLNDMYLVLVARTAADDHAVAEISELTERTATAQAFQQAVQELGLAASALEFP